MAGPKTYRRVPSDIDQAKRIHALMTKDLEANVLTLSQEGRLDELHHKLNDAAEWKQIVEDLTILGDDDDDDHGAARMQQPPSIEAPKPDAQPPRASARRNTAVPPTAPTTPPSAATEAK